jgi:DNA-binding MarR family transcriptional regulator
MARRGKEGSWTLLTSHGHVLVEIARNPEALMKELSAAAGITERATAMIVADLVDVGYVTRERVGRRNRYSVHLDRGFRHAQQGGLQVGPFLELLTEGRLSRVAPAYLAQDTLDMPEAGGDASQIADAQDVADVSQIAEARDAEDASPIADAGEVAEARDVEGAIAS